MESRIVNQPLAKTFGWLRVNGTEAEPLREIGRAHV